MVYTANCNVFDLTARYDARASFYGKAKVIDYGNGVYELQSYDTIVSRCVNGKVTHFDYGKPTRTTTRHQREFEKQFTR